jgi:hypothetical protein
MKTPKVFIVVLRRPRRRKDEKREDPFWEFGSFGSTGCKRKSLLNPAKAKERLQGARLAFAQGGADGFRLVKVTPPLRIDDSKVPCEAKWKPRGELFRYTDAPLIAAKDGRTDFPSLRAAFRKRTCAGQMQQFSSNFRSSAEPLSVNQAKALIRIYGCKVRTARKEMFARSYLDALPYNPPVAESPTQRRHSYSDCLKHAEETAPKKSCSRPPRIRRCRPKRQVRKR